MNTTTPRLRAHLLAELRDLPDRTATTDQLAGQIPCPYALDRGVYRGSSGQVVYRHLVSLQKQGRVRKIKRADVLSVSWQLVTA